MTLHIEPYATRREAAARAVALQRGGSRVTLATTGAPQIVVLWIETTHQKSEEGTPMTTETYAVFPWREDNRYSLADAIGAHVYGRRSTADARAERLTNAVPAQPWCPRGFVARATAICHADGYTVYPNGQIHG